jgi:outer membrane protein assembly factor BamB
MRATTLALSLTGLLALGAISPARATDWPQFRGPAGSAFSPDAGYPLRWSAKENIRWKADLPGRGVSCPIIAAGRVYVTACSGYQQQRLHVLCFDAATGKRLWERQFRATGPTMCNPQTCMAAPTPCTDGQRIYALFATGDLACLDREGDLLWYRSLVGDYPNVTNQVGMAASPILYQDTLLLPLENVGSSFAAGLDAATGQNRWKNDRRRDLNWVTPQLFLHEGRMEALFQTAADLTAYDPTTGITRWVYTAGKPSSVIPPVVVDGLVLVPNEGLVVLRPPREGGRPEVILRSNRLRAAYSSPLAWDGRVYAVNGSAILNCVRQSDGKALWQQRLQGMHWASAVAAGDCLYVVNEQGLTTVLKLGDEAKVLARNWIEDTIMATPALADGAIYLRSDQHLYCIAGQSK